MSRVSCKVIFLTSDGTNCLLLSKEGLSAWRNVKRARLHYDMRWLGMFSQLFKESHMMPVNTEEMEGVRTKGERRHSESNFSNSKLDGDCVISCFPFLEFGSRDLF